MENRELIAEFMGVVFHDDEDQYYDADGYYIGRTLQYYTSWDWLMPVANKIIKSRDEKNADWDLTDLKYALCTTNFELIYKAVSKFIQEYGRAKKPRENNKLIAEFIQKGSKGFGLYDFDGCHYESDADGLNFHASWDWLMPVVEKIEDLGYDVIIRQGTCEIIGEEVNGMEYDNFECFDAGKHITTYSAVVKFIKWHNKNK